MTVDAAHVPAVEDLAAPIEDAGVRDRDAAPGFWSVGWPLLALGVIAAALVNSCVGASHPPIGRFDSTAAMRKANATAREALATLTADTPPADVITAVNLIVVDFALGSSELPADARDLLKRAAPALAALPSAQRIEVRGHTDGFGTRAGNDELSLRRAEAVAAALAANGVAPERLVTRAYGERMPIADNATDEGRFRNRRIEFALMR